MRASLRAVGLPVKPKFNQVAEQRLRVFEIGCVEPFGKPAINRREKVACFGAAALVAAEPGEAHGGAQFPELGLLLLRNAQGFAIKFLGGLGMPLAQQQPGEALVRSAFSKPSSDRVMASSICPAISHALARRAVK